jgi:microcystin-dependent protein
MADPFLAEIRIVSFNFAPKGWAMCNGQLLPINQNQPLFALLGNTYGGDGRVNFALPDLRGRVPFFGGRNTIALGERAGEEAHTLIQSEMPSHTHMAFASSNIASQPGPSGNFWVNDPVLVQYASIPDAVMSPAAVATTGSSQPHQNMPPYLVLNFVIALVGIFPPNN